MESLKEKAKALLQQCEVVTLTSINKEGYPRPVPLSKIKTEGLTTIWFATGNSSAKTKDFRSNPKAGICFYKEGNSVAMTGEVEVVSDTGTKKELWQDWFIHHFPKGPEDPEYTAPVSPLPTAPHSAGIPVQDQSPDNRTNEPASAEPGHTGNVLKTLRSLAALADRCRHIHPY